MATNKPTFRPTSTPTYDLNYEAHFTYTRYVTARDAYRALNDSFTMSTYYFKGLSEGHSCSGWDSFYTNSISLPFDDVQFSTLTAVFGNYNFGSRVNRTTTAVCSDKSVIKNIIAYLKSGAAYEANCNGVTWRVFSCSEQRIVCVNCKKVCVNTEICPGRNYLVNPCTTGCKSHTSASAVVNFAYERIKLYPLIRKTLLQVFTDKEPTNYVLRLSVLL